MNKNRKFSVAFPYLDKDETVEQVVEYFSQFGEAIENMYVGIPSLGNNYHNAEYHLQEEDKHGKTLEQYEVECLKFLELTKGKFKRLITLNSGCYAMSHEDMVQYVDKKLIPFIDEHAVDGAICTDFNMACLLHEARPNLELHTSCNSYIETTHEMKMWHEYAGISVFNPPREFLRQPERLKEMRATGFRLKYLVNESCLFGCPQSKNHLMAQAVNNKHFHAGCYHCKDSNFLRSVCIVPRWMDKLDEYVDIYKISGRMCPFASVRRSFEAYYYQQDDVNMGAITYGSGSMTFKNVLAKDFPDKLLHCECKDCESCGLCDRIMKRCMSPIYYKCDYTEEEYKNLIKTYESIGAYSGQVVKFGKDKFGEYFELKYKE